MNAMHFLTLKMNTIKWSVQQLYLATPTQCVNPHNKVSSQLPTALKGKGKTRSCLSKNHFHWFLISWSDDGILPFRLIKKKYAVMLSVSGIFD